MNYTVASSLTVDDLHRLYRQWPQHPSNYILAESREDIA